MIVIASNLKRVWGAEPADSDPSSGRTCSTKAASGLALLLVAAPAAAQDMPAAQDVVVTANRSERAADEIGQSVSVLDAATIETRQATTVLDLLRTLPGVSVTRAGGPGTAASVNIRGADPQQTVLLIDGVKVDDPAAPSGGYDFGNLLVGTVERIEVVRGSQSVIWGRQAIGGVVNVVTKAPTVQPELTARAEYGWRDSAQLVANASASFGPVAASLGGNYLVTDGFSAFAPGAERDGYRNYGAAGKVVVTASDALSFDLRARYSDGRVDLDGFPSPAFAFADTLEFSTTRELVGYGGVNLALFGGRLKNRLGYATTRIDRTNFDSPATARETFGSRGTNARVEYQGTVELGALAAVFGAERELSKLRTTSSPPARAEITSFYGEATVRPVSGVALSAGVRHDDHDRFGGATTFAANGSVSPNGGATRLRASYGEGFGVPSLFRLYSNFGNPALRVERSKSWDAGVVQRFLGGAAEVGATWFHRDTTDQIDFVSCFGVTGGICTGRPFGTYDNVRATRAEGVEAMLTLRPGDGFVVSGNYTYLNARNRLNGRELARRPRETASLVVDHRWRFGLAAGATLTHVGDSFDDVGNARRLDGFVLADLRASLPVTGSLEVYGRVENLFDARYQAVFGYGTAGRAAYGGVRVRL